MSTLTTPRRVRNVAALVAALAFAFAALTAQPASADNGTASNITVTHLPAADTGACQPRFDLLRVLFGHGDFDALRFATINTPSTFTLRITSAAKLCDPFDATAVIYAMPGDGQAWPQTRVERTTFRVERAGTIEVQFTKTCAPVQFDVVIGDTPDTVAPWGPWHGPLISGLDNSTALQHWGFECEAAQPPTTVTTTTIAVPSTLPPATTTTTAAPTTTTTVEATTTTVEATTTTVTPTTVSPTTMPATVDSPANVETATEPEPVRTAVAGKVAQAPAELALTGSSTGLQVAAGIALLVAGAVALSVAARRRSS